MRPEMPPGLFKKIIFHRQLANLALQLDDLASVLHRRQTNASPSNSRKRQFPLGAPLRAPAIQQFRTQLIFARSLTGTSAGLQAFRLLVLLPSVLLPSVFCLLLPHLRD